jgi:hypothetical protein
MKKTLFLFCLLLPIGCKTATSTTPPAALAPGALNVFDSATYEALAAAHAFALSASTNAATLTVTEKSDLNTFITALNAADILYAAYHSGAATQAQMQTSLNSVTTSQATFSASVTGAK